MHHQSPPYPSSVVFQTIFIFFLSKPSMLTHTNPSHLFSFSLYLYSRKKNAKTVKSQNDKTTKKKHTHTQQQNSGTPPFLKPTTSQFPKSSPEKPLIDHQNHHRSKQLKPGEKQFPNSSPASFPIFGTYQFLTSSPPLSRDRYLSL